MCRLVRTNFKDAHRCADSSEKLYTYSIITTDSNKQIRFLHDRMPVILESGSEEIRTWLDPDRTTWSKELQSLLRPYEVELEIYPVPKEVSKVGNNSPSFIVPVDSKENKNNIANFFADQKKMAKGGEEKKVSEKGEHDAKSSGETVKQEPDEDRETTNQEGSEDNAPLPATTKDQANKDGRQELKREASDDMTAEQPREKSQKVEEERQTKALAGGGRRSRSATSNGTAAKSSPAKASGGNGKITKFLIK